MVDYEYAELFNNDSLDKQIHITASGGVDLGNDDLISESFQLIESLCSEEYLTFGAVEPRCVRFTVKYSAPKLLNKWLTITMDLQGAETPFPFGDYQVLSDKPSSDRTTREVTAYSHFHKIIKNKYKSWYKNAWGNSNEMTVKQFRDSFFSYLAQTHSWIVQETTSLVNDDVVIKKSKKISRISGKDVLNAICEINGVFGYVDRDSVFRYKVLDNHNTTTDIDSSHTISTEYEDYSTTVIDRVEILSENGDLIASAGSSESSSQNKYVVENNFMLKGLGNGDAAQDTLQFVASHLLNVISNVTYTPFEAEFKGNPCFEVGDRISFQSHGTTIYSYVLQRTMKGIQSLHDNFVAESGDAVYPEDTNTLSSKLQKIKDYASEKNEINVDSYEPNDYDLTGQEGDMYVQETHKTPRTNVSKTFSCYETYYGAINNLYWYSYDNVKITCNVGNFIICAARTTQSGRTWVVAGSKSRKIEWVRVICKVPVGAQQPTFTCEVSDVEEFNSPPPPPFEQVDPGGFGDETGTSFSYNGQYVENTAHTYRYYYATFGLGTWVGSLKYEDNEPDYVFDSIRDLEDALKADTVVIPEMYDGADTNHVYYNNGTGGDSAWKKVATVSNVSESDDAGGTENNGMVINQETQEIALKKNVIRAWYKPDPPQVDRKFSQLCVRYTGSPDKQVNVTAYASHEWQNDKITKDDDNVLKIKCKGTTDGTKINYAVYAITGLTLGKKYYFNFKCKFAAGTSFDFDMTKGCGLVFNTSGVLSTGNWSGDEDKFYPATNYYAFRRMTNAWYADFELTADATTMYMCVVMQAVSGSSNFTMSEFVISQKERELIRNIYLYDYTAKAWLKYKPFSGSTSGGDEGGSVVAIEPTLSSGTKIANFSIDGEPGALYAPDNEYELPIASAETLGGIKVGQNLSIDEDGTLNASGGGGTGAEELSDLDDIQISNLSDGQILKYDSSTHKWGNVDNISDALGYWVSTEQGTIYVPAVPELTIADDYDLATGKAVVEYVRNHQYSLPTASANTLGGIKVGQNLSIDQDGTLNATGGGGGSSTFAGLSDVTLSNLADGQVPKYNATTQKWENANESGGDESIVLTQAEYDALPTSEKEDITKTYYISDAPSIYDASLNYSTSERVVGTWIDGKPLYQRTFDLGSDTNIPSNTWTDVNVPNTGLKALWFVICANSTGAALCGFSATLNTSGSNIRILQSRNATVGVRYVTIQYTKNSD